MKLTHSTAARLNPVRCKFALLHSVLDTPVKKLHTLRATPLCATLLACATLLGCGGGAVGLIEPGNSLTISPATAQLQGNWTSCDPLTNAAGAAIGSTLENLNFDFSPAQGNISLAITDTTYSSADCTGTPVSTQTDTSIRINLQGAALLADGSLVEKADVTGTSRLSQKQVLKISSKQLVLGDTSQPRDNGGYPSVLQKRSFKKL